MRVPAIELSECIRCGICVDLSPEIFTFSPSGYVVVLERTCYPVEDVDDAIKNCPGDCIFWQDA